MVENILLETYPYTGSNGGRLHHAKAQPKKDITIISHVMAFNINLITSKIYILQIIFYTKIRLPTQKTTNFLVVFIFFKKERKL